MNSNEIKRYDIYLANLDPTIGSEIKKNRPVVVISDNMMNKYLGTIVVCPITTNIHSKWRSRIQIKGLEKLSEIAVDQIRSISKLRILNKLGSIDKDEAKLLRLTITEMYGE